MESRFRGLLNSPLFVLGGRDSDTDSGRYVRH